MKKLYFLLILLVATSLSAQVINFPDPVLKAKLLAASSTNNIAAIANPSSVYVKIDTNNNGEIEQSEATLINRLVISNSGISDLTGINFFTGLSSLRCEGNSLTTLDISSLTLIEGLQCQNNQLTSLLFPQISPATDRSMNIICNNNALTDIDLSSFKHFSYLNLASNQLTAINLGFIQVSSLDLSNNQFVSFNYTVPPMGYIENLGISTETLVDFYYDASQAGAETSLSLSGNNLTSVTFKAPDTGTGFTMQQCNIHGASITELNIRGSFSILNITDIACETLDLTNCKPSTFSLFSSQTKYVKLKNGFVSGTSVFGSQNNQLEYVCADDGEVSALIAASIDWNEAAEINSYCSFTPGATFYTIAGSAKYDLFNNGCDISDIAYPNLKYNISNGTVSGSITSNSLGIYQIPVQEGTHTIQPNIENPAYFNISPASIAINFPAVASPYNQDFCITPNGVHADLEVSMIPLSAASPGFDADYKLIYKNKGNVAISGTVDFSYGNNVEFVSATPNVSSQATQVLNWDFSGLQPFEQREIFVTMNVNSPTETPAVNDGDILHFSFSGSPDLNDEMPDDNSAFLNQPVFNSLDPNDKTCLEGNTIAPTMVGKYVHYQIRFENTGSANAQNIVVKDMIDTDKFDINSLIAMDGSHDFYTRISGNKVEFIFENIQLPFDDTNNDGYVMFKIKTKASLVVGNTFSNVARIYFDYNFPIVTEPAVTTISVLATKDFEFSDEFALFPNPTQTILNIQSKNNTNIQSIDIYNTLGQLVLAITKTENNSKIDVSDLTIGNYFIKINSDKGISNTRFVKQ